MIVFYDAQLAPRSFCELLHHVVPEELHVPVVFKTKPSQHGGPLASVGPGVDRNLHIEVYLHKIYATSFYRSSSIPAALWRQLLETCLHEFGHIATGPLLDPAAHCWGAYCAGGPAYKYIERLANEWMRRKIDELLDRDPRLGQPRRHLTGYFGGRHARLMRSLSGNSSGAATGLFVRETRCAKTGGQLTAGHLVTRLSTIASAQRSRSEHPYIADPYRLLRRLSTDLGIKHTDRAGRQHTLFTWGDAREVERRFGRGLERGEIRLRHYPYVAETGSPVASDTACPMPGEPVSEDEITALLPEILADELRRW
jgi:hypothetical protein